MRKQDVYCLLEEKMLGYTDYADVPVDPVYEPLVPIPDSRDLVARQIGTDMESYTGGQIFVRYGVLRRLEQAAKLLSEQYADLQFEVVYGYRALEIQKRLFEEYKLKLEPEYQGDALLAATHRLIAVPEVAGHPAGAAVDIQITKNGKPLDFGTKIHEFVPDTFTFSPFIGSEGWNTSASAMRDIRQVALDGEWWHFSYGDKSGLGITADLLLSTGRWISDERSVPLKNIGDAARTYREVLRA
jgi:D-alanyl-D-alanine dipeptidase